MVIESTIVAVLACVVPLLHLLGLFSAVEALYRARSSQGAIAWSLFLVIFPYAGLPFYWILGRSKFRGYREKLARVVQHQKSGLAWYHQQISRYSVNIAEKLPGGVEAFSRISERRFVGGNHVQLLVDGAETFQAIFQAIDAAKVYVLVEFFIIKDDLLGVELKKRLISAAQRGIKVFVLYDEIGSHKLSAQYREELSSNGVHITPFGTRKGLQNFFQVNFRNHRKIVVVDGQVAFIGGLNVGDEYLGRDSRFGHWRDTHLQLEGPAALEAKALFVVDWVWASGQVPAIETIEPIPTGDLPVLTMGSGPADERDRCLLFFLECIASARSRVWIASPYFVPDEALLSALQLAALRGVDVRILLPAKRDHTLVWLASFFFVPAVATYGVKVYRYTNGFMHQKVVVVDDVISAIGTANFDNRSFRLNFEVMSIVADREFSAQVTSMMERDFSGSIDVSHERFGDYPLWKQVGSKFARLFSPVL
jgi:cardiolipin synthase